MTKTEYMAELHKLNQINQELARMLRVAHAKISGDNTAAASDVIKVQIERVLQKAGL